MQIYYLYLKYIQEKREKIMKHLTKKLIVVVLAFMSVVCMAVAVAACGDNLTPLSAPVISIDENGVISWEAVDHAEGYYVNENGVKVAEVDSSPYTITQNVAGNYSYTVVAVGDGVNYSNSPASNAQSYIVASPDATPLSAPEITLNERVISWTAVENATGYNVYVNNSFVESVTVCTYTIGQNTPGVYQYHVVATTTNIDYKSSVASNKVNFVIGAETLSVGGGPVVVEVDVADWLLHQQIELGDVEFGKYYFVKFTLISCVDEEGNDVKVESFTVNGNDNQVEDYEWQYGFVGILGTTITSGQTEVVIQGPTCIWTKVNAVGGDNYKTLVYAVELATSTKQPPEIEEDDGQLKTEGALAAGVGFEVIVKNMPALGAVEIPYDILNAPTVGNTYKLVVKSASEENNPNQKYLTAGLNFGYIFAESVDDYNILDVTMLPDIYGFGYYAADITIGAGKLIIVSINDEVTPLFEVVLSNDLLNNGGDDDDVSALAPEGSMKIDIDAPFGTDVPLANSVKPGKYTISFSSVNDLADQLWDNDIIVSVGGTQFIIAKDNHYTGEILISGIVTSINIAGKNSYSATDVLVELSAVEEVGLFVGGYVLVDLSMITGAEEIALYNVAADSYYIVLQGGELELLFGASIELYIGDSSSAIELSSANRFTAFVTIGEGVDKISLNLEGNMINNIKVWLVNSTDDIPEELVYLEADESVDFDIELGGEVVFNLGESISEGYYTVIIGGASWGLENEGAELYLFLGDNYNNTITLDPGNGYSLVIYIDSSIYYITIASPSSAGTELSVKLAPAANGTLAAGGSIDDVDIPYYSNAVIVLDENIEAGTYTITITGEWLESEWFYSDTIIVTVGSRTFEVKKEDGWSAQIVIGAHDHYITLAFEMDGCSGLTVSLSEKA